MPGSGDGAASTVLKAITTAKQKHSVSMIDLCRRMSADHVTLERVPALRNISSQLHHENFDRPAFTWIEQPKIGIVGVQRSWRKFCICY